MKKSLFLLLGALLCLTAPGLSAQTEVRGIETRRVVYDGPEYGYSYNMSRSKYEKWSTEYYGFEFYNRNSIPVSVSIELWCQGYYDGYYWLEKPTLITTKEAVLDAGEKYIFKPERSDNFREHQDTHMNMIGINSYYVKYKAYKLE